MSFDRFSSCAASSSSASPRRPRFSTSSPRPSRHAFTAHAACCKSSCTASSMTSCAIRTHSADSAATQLSARFSRGSVVSDLPRKEERPMLVMSRGFTAFAALISIVAIGGAHAQNQNQNQSQNEDDNQGSPAAVGGDVWQHAAQQVAKGRNTFRFDTFGDEGFWGGALGLHKTIEGAEN